MPSHLRSCPALGRYSSGVHDVCDMGAAGATSLRGFASRPRAPACSLPRPRRVSPGPHVIVLRLPPSCIGHAGACPGFLPARASSWLLGCSGLSGRLSGGLSGRISGWYGYGWALASPVLSWRGACSGFPATQLFSCHASEWSLVHFLGFLFACDGYAHAPRYLFVCACAPYDRASGCSILFACAG